MIWIMSAIFIPIIIGGVWLGIIMCKTSDEAWDAAFEAPKFIIKPSYDLGYDLWEKELWPMYNCCPPMVHYRPLLGHYKNLEDAKNQLTHYMQSNDEKPND